MSNESDPLAFKSFYDTIGIEKTATQAEITAAYRAKALLLHPDKGGSHTAFCDLQAAYEILRDPQKRAMYDKHGFPESARKWYYCYFFCCFGDKYLSKSARDAHVKDFHFPYKYGPKDWGKPLACPYSSFKGNCCRFTTDKTKGLKSHITMVHEAVTGREKVYLEFMNPKNRRRKVNRRALVTKEPKQPKGKAKAKAKATPLAIKAEEESEEVVSEAETVYMQPEEGVVSEED